MHRFHFNPQVVIVAVAGLAVASGLPMQASDMDNRIEAAALSSYNFRTYLKDDQIKVVSNNGEVTLSGVVAHEYHRYLAENTVANLPGVKSVINQLTLPGNSPTEKSDAWITMKVKGALVFHENVSAKDTEVHTLNGIVTLTGKADSEAQKQLTREYVRDVEGVVEVRNELVVSGSGKHSHRTMGEKIDDSSITAQIKTALVFHKSTHPVDTTVHTKDGVVTLTGEAKNAAEKELVAKLAEDIRGVKHVKNHMSVRK